MEPEKKIDLTEAENRTVVYQLVYEWLRRALKKEGWVRVDQKELHYN